MISPKIGENLAGKSDIKATLKRQPTCQDEFSANQILEKIKSDRVTITNPKEDRNRRTIIVERQNGTFGFSLQSYGIHYKKEQEIEMITYVDHVDYDGSAFRAGMREGDVILSIDGHDMEKADHKMLVNFIQKSGNRMRMVVLFEDCVRKVELHLRYIQLKEALRVKTEKLEKLCQKESEILSGSWRTHSLPARRKLRKGDPVADESPRLREKSESSINRSASSTENMRDNKLAVTYLPHPRKSCETSAHSDNRCFMDPNGTIYYLRPPISSNSSEHLVKGHNSRYRGNFYESRERAKSQTKESHHKPREPRGRSSHSANNSLTRNESKQPQTTHSNVSTRVNITIPFGKYAPNLPKYRAEDLNAGHKSSQRSLQSGSSGQSGAERTSYTTLVSTDTLYWDEPRRYINAIIKPVKSCDNILSTSHDRTPKSIILPETRAQSAKSHECLSYQHAHDASVDDLVTTLEPIYISNEQGRFVAVQRFIQGNQRSNTDTKDNPETTRL